MATNEKGETLESLLNEATNPVNAEDDWDIINDFCDKVNAEFEGVQISTKLLIHKMQSPQERESLQALTVLEACVKNCGENFHKELGKYRFLNELIKLVSPKYLGSQTTQKVQQKVIGMLYTWSVALTEQVKIRDAYQMLKKQGIVKVDPPFNQSLISNPPPPPPDRDTLFTDDEKRKELDKLLKSTKPEDLQAANRLIKSVVKEDEAKMDKLRKRNKTIEEVNNNVKLLNEMLAHFNPENPVIDDMTMMKELYDGCQKLRPTLFRLASDTDDDEAALMNILRANDDVSRAMLSYEKTVQPKLNSMVDRKADGAAEPTNEETPKQPDPSSSLLELSGLNLNAHTSSTAQAGDDVFKPFASFTPNNQTTITNGLNDNLLSFPAASAVSPSNDVDSLLDLLSPKPVPTASVFPPAQPQIPKLPTPPQAKQPAKPPMFADIGDLSRDLMEKSLGGKVAGSAFPEPAAKLTLNEMSLKPVGDTKATHPDVTSQTDTTAIFDMSFPTSAPEAASSRPDALLQPAAASPPMSLPVPAINTAAPPQDTSLNDVSVPLESIRPSTFPPITAYDNNGIRILIHFAKDHAAPTRTDTLVSVVSILSTRTNPVQNIIFQAAAPKVMKVKLQPPSNTELPAYNPIFTAPPLTQIMIISNPDKKEVKIRYKLDYKIDQQTSISESGLITGFPPAEQWGKL